MVMSSVPAASGEDNAATQITAMPAGAKMELHLKNNQTQRGAKGPVSNVGFTLVDAHKGEHQIVFDEVASVKQLKSHTTRNILIGVGIGVAALGITAVILLRCGPLGCANRTAFEYPGSHRMLLHAFRVTGDLPGRLTAS
jgi:hypothetical protein